MARDGLLGESHPSGTLANAVCNICITSEQGTAFCTVSNDRKQTTYAFVSWRVARNPPIQARQLNHVQIGRSTLFLAQCHYGIHGACPAGGHIAGNQRHSEEDQADRKQHGQAERTRSVECALQGATERVRSQQP